ncbi:SGNH/GDSL hydrolase family protein [Nocardia sp. XZ_19_369]|uniref:SGNH/GDSL hydrolase family protein n=1 Tax=Nocardia sp. XZ_19_369 TaxID=2769487 RepID=UPI00188F050E|nr:SGNH/GDSL hydrolase family protein [Nocardia sp. XZ_19_369]
MARRSTLLRTLAIAAAAVTSAGLGPAVAAAQPGAQYVALGSSYAAGPGIAPVADTGCARSAQNYPRLLADALGLGLGLTDVTCSGATTAHILDTAQRLRDGRSVPAQLDAVTADTRLVTVTIGGNDLRLVGTMITQSCGNAAVQAFSLPTAAADAVTRGCALGGGDLAGPSMDTDYGRVEQALVRIADAVHAKAPNARVLFVDYLPVVDREATACAAVPLQPHQASAARAGYDGLLAATARAARSAGADVIEVDQTHTPCTPSPWVTGFADPFTRTPDLAAVMSSYHPNLDGMTAIAQQIAGLVSR